MMSKQLQALKSIFDLAIKSIENTKVGSTNERELEHIARIAHEAWSEPAQRSRSMYEDVADFHFKFGIPVAGSGPCKMPAADIIEYRTKFLEEELTEFKDACAEDNLPEAFDALMDIVWVAMGTAHYFGMPWDEGWAEVARANMDRVIVTRENCPLGKRYRRDMVMKPPGWKPPQLLRVIRDYNLRILSRQKQLDIPEFLRKFPNEPQSGVIGAGLGITFNDISTKLDDDFISEFVVDGKQNTSTEHHSFACTCERCVPNDEATGD